MSATLTDLGLCTRNPEHGPAEVPWSGDRLCWSCADHELDLIALQAQTTESWPVELRYTPAPKPTPTQDELVAALAEDLLALCGQNVDRINKVLAKLGTEEVWDGKCTMADCPAR